MKKLIGVLGLTLVVACVPQGKYDATVKDLGAARAQMANDAQARKELEDRIAKLQMAIDAAGQALKEGTKQLQDAEAHAASLQKKLDDATALEAQLRKELEKLGKDADKLLAEK